MGSNLKILVLRTDNLGDLLLTLPAIRFLRQNLPQAELSLVIKAPFHKLLSTYLDSFKIKMLHLEDCWEQEKWSACLALYCDFREALRLWKSQSPFRVGSYSRAWSFLLFNKGLRQRKSLATKSEAVYSIELAQLLARTLKAPQTLDSSPIVLPVDSEEKKRAERKLEDLRIQKDEKFYVVHPGMAGSALNLKPDHYVKIIEKLSTRGQVLVSVGPGKQDQILWTELSAKKQGLKKLEGLDLSVLKEVFRESAAVIAPSTGPLHLAAAVGVQTVGIYSPVKSHHPLRWSPWGGALTSQILFPEVSCPAKQACLGTKCKIYNCMDQVNWASLILDAINGLT